MSGMFTNGMPLASASPATYPLTGNETIPCDTNLTAGSGPESVALTTAMLGLAGNPTVLTDAAAVTLANSPNQSILMTANTTFTAPANAGNFTLTLTQDATGSRTATWPSSMIFVGGSKTLSTAANAIDTVQAIWSPTVAAGVVTARWLCSLLKAYA